MVSECVVCGTDENIHTHHINGDESDDRDSNLVDLCSRHHRQVHGESDLDRLKDDRVLELKDELPDRQKKNVVCEHCGYDWTTESVREKATCPSCQRKTLVDDDSNDG